MSQPPWGDPQGQPVPQYQPPGAPEPPTGALVCPKCRGTMRTYERNGIHLEQCDTCRGIFLDFGELEALTRLEANLAQPHPQAQQPPQQPATVVYTQPGYGPAWGHHGDHRYRRGGFGRLFFSS